MKQRHKNARCGFTLIELLVSLALLVMISLAVSNVFSNATRAMSKGTAQSAVNLSARTALDLVANELAGAFLSTNCLMAVDAERVVLSEEVFGEHATVSMISFFSTSSLLGKQVTKSSEYARSVYPVTYFLDRERNLIREYITPVTYKSRGEWVMGCETVTSYFGRDWQFEEMSDGDKTTIVDVMDLIAENITEFTVLINGLETFTQFVPSAITSAAATNFIPRYVDIVMGVISDDAAKKAKYLSGAQLTDFVRKNEQLFSTRVNLMGAKAAEFEIQNLGP